MESKVLNSKLFGVPQNRERIFVLATREKRDVLRNLKGYDCGVRLRDVLETKVEQKYYLSEQNLQHYMREFGAKGKLQNKNGACDTLLASMGNGGGIVPIVDSANRCIELTSGESQGNRVYSANGTSVTLAAEAGGGGAKTGLYVVQANGRNGTKWKETEVLHTVTRHIHDTGSESGAVVVGDVGIRKLTPKECFRLMGFSSSDYEACKCVGMSDTQLYKQAGNSIVVNVLMAIFGELYGVDWKEKVYGEWYKTEQERLLDLPLL